MERRYISDSEAYNVFVGQLTPQEFIKPFGSFNPIAKAIDNLIKNWTHDEPVPSWLESALFRYVEDRVDDEPPITRLSVPFELMTDIEQEQALRVILRQMTPAQQQQALLIVQEFLLADKLEAMCLEAQKAGYEPVSNEQVQSTVDAVQSFINEQAQSTSNAVRRFMDKDESN